jgi:dTDP-4-dehydrorhamnose 3,5-epimerase
MKVTLTDFEDLLIIEPNFFQDERGSFYESWRQDEYKNIGINEAFVQDNVSMSRKDVLRGLHFQKNQGRLVTVTHGKIFDVAVDMRAHSRTFKKYYSIVLEGSSPQQFYIPPGFAHGFCVLSDFAIINYKSTTLYNPAEEGGIIWNDPQLCINWPINSPIMSDKDRKHDELLQALENTIRNQYKKVL